MKSLLQDIFDKLAAAPEAADDDTELQLATAALLIEMVRADMDVDDAEMGAVREALRHEFALDEAAVNDLVAQADAEARDAPGYFAFTSRINHHLNTAQKVRIVEYLWRVAFADGKLGAHENHLMRKLADLIHVGHGDYIAAKSRAREYHERHKPS